MKYCKIIKDIYNGTELVWAKDQEYKVIYENSIMYLFGGIYNKYAIGKDTENINYVVVEKEEGSNV